MYLYFYMDILSMLEFAACLFDKELKEKTWPLQGSS